MISKRTIKLLSDTKLKSIEFDNKDYVLNELDLGVPKIKLSTFQGYKQIGENVTGRSFGGRDISITGFILASGAQEMANKKRDLQRIISTDSFFYLMVDDTYKMAVYPDATIEFAVERYKNNSQLAQFMITGEAVQPYFSELTEKSLKLVYWTSLFKFTANSTTFNNVVFGSKSASNQRSVNYEGDLNTGCIFTLKFAGPVSTVTINHYSDTEGETEKLTIEGSFVAGDTVVIDSRYGQKDVKLNGVSKCFSIVNKDSNFITMLNGVNVFEFTASDVDLVTVDLAYTPLYLEV